MIAEFFITLLIVAVTAVGIVVAMRLKERREKSRKLAYCDSVIVVQLYPDLALDAEILDAENHVA